MFTKFLTSIVFAIGMTVSAQAATLTATFDAPATRGSSTLAPNDIINLTMTDLASGGVEITVTALDATEGIGSFFLLGQDAGDFVGPTGIFNTSFSNVYRSDLGGDGAVFGTNDLSIFEGASLTFSSVSTLLSTADFSGLTVGFIVTTLDTPDRLQGLYGGSLSEVSPVPLPAGLPLILVGLGALAVVRRKTTKAA
jgi:hypothetical protein